MNGESSALPEKIKSNNKAPKFDVGDRIRINKYRNIFSKGYPEHWSREIFIIDSVLNQTLNQTFFRAGKLSWNLGNSINISSKTQDKKYLQEKRLEIFPLDTLKTPRWIQSGTFFQNQFTLFNFHKRGGESSLFSLVARL